MSVSKQQYLFSVGKAILKQYEGAYRFVPDTI